MIYVYRQIVKWLKRNELWNESEILRKNLAMAQFQIALRNLPKRVKKRVKSVTFLNKLFLAPNWMKYFLNQDAYVIIKVVKKKIHINNLIS